jgi:hypothetical protein
MDRNANAAVGSKTDLIVSRTNLGKWLTSVCGYADVKAALKVAKRFNPPGGGLRPWLQVPHAETGEEMKLFLSASGGHTWDTVKQSGLRLDVVEVAPNGTSGRQTNMWSTANPSLFDELTAVGTLEDLLAGDDGNTDDLPF